MTRSQKHARTSQFYPSMNPERTISDDHLSSPSGHICTDYFECKFYGHFEPIDEELLQICVSNGLSQGDLENVLDTCVGDGMLVLQTNCDYYILIPPFSEKKYYWCASNGCIMLFEDFSSYAQHQRAIGAQIQFDQSFISTYLASERFVTDRTLISGLKELRHSHSYKLCNDGETQSSSLIAINHLPNLIARQRYIFDDENTLNQRILDLTEKAVKFKSSQGNRVGLTASGGFDSSAIAVFLSRLIPNEDINFYHLYSNRFFGINEIDYLNHIRKQVPNVCRWIDIESCGDHLLRFEHMKAHFRPPKVMSFFEKNWKIQSCAASDDVDLILSGDGGDQLMLCFASHDLASDFKSEGIPFIPAITNASMIGGTSAWDIFWKLMASSSEADTRYKLKTSNVKIDNTVLNSSKLRISDFTTLEDFSSYENLSVSRIFQIVALSSALENSIHGTGQRVIERKPFLYWPFIKLSLGMARIDHYWAGRERGAFRRAYNGILPTAILNRFDKSGAVEATRIYEFSEINEHIDRIEDNFDHLDRSKILKKLDENQSDDDIRDLCRLYTLSRMMEEITHEIA